MSYTAVTQKFHDHLEIYLEVIYLNDLISSETFESLEIAAVSTGSEPAASLESQVVVCASDASSSVTLRITFG